MHCAWCVCVAIIDKFGMRNEVIKMLSDPDNLYSADEISDALSDMCGSFIHSDEILDVRRTYMLEQKRKSAMTPVPLKVPNALPDVPRSFQELCAYSQFDVLGLYGGATKEAFRIYKNTLDENDNKTAIQSLRLLMDLGATIDKKIKAMNATDPSSQVFSNMLLTSINDCLAEIHQEYPDFHLLDKLQQKLEAKRSSQTIDITEDN